jgi:hypothetical protein
VIVEEERARPHCSRTRRRARAGRLAQAQAARFYMNPSPSLYQLRSGSEQSSSAERQSD